MALGSDGRASTARLGIDRAIRGAAAWAALGFVLACSHGAPPPPEEGPMGRAEYVIGPADILEIRVWKQNDLAVDVTVRPDGKISVPLVNDVQAAGLTAIEVRDVLTKALADYVAAPDVTVIVKEIRSKNVQVMGEVARPAIIPLSVDMRVIDAIAAASGFTAYADKGDVRILRPGASGTVTEYRFNYNAFLRGKNPGSNMLLHPGDTIVVPD